MTNWTSKPESLVALKFSEMRLVDSNGEMFPKSLLPKRNGELVFGNVKRLMTVKEVCAMYGCSKNKAQAALRDAPLSCTTDI